MSTKSIASYYRGWWVRLTYLYLQKFLWSDHKIARVILGRWGLRWWLPSVRDESALKAEQTFNIPYTSQMLRVQDQLIAWGRSDHIDSETFARAGPGPWTTGDLAEPGAWWGMPVGGIDV